MYSRNNKICVYKCAETDDNRLAYASIFFRLWLTWSDLKHILVFK